MKDLTPDRSDLDPIEIASRDEISALQLKRLKWSLGHAYENVPWYREKFDAIGMYREEENGVAIDTSGERDGVPYDDAVGLGVALSEHPGLGPCLVRSLYRYAVGRSPELGEELLLGVLSERFAESGYLVSELLRDILSSEGFRKTSGPRDVELSEDDS